MFDIPSLTSKTQLTQFTIWVNEWAGNIDRLWALLTLALLCFLESDLVIAYMVPAASYFARELMIMKLVVLSTFEALVLSYSELGQRVFLPGTLTHLWLENLPS